MKNTALSLSLFFLLGSFLTANSTSPDSYIENSCLSNACVSVICPPDITVDCIEDFTIEATDAIAVSNCGMITAQWVTNPLQSGPPDCPATVYIYTYKALDDQGNIGCCERKVTIDNMPPSIIVPPGTMVECYNDVNVDESDATVMTSCGESLNVTLYPPVLNGTKDCPGTTYTWTYRVIDLCGREATADRVFTNGDNDPPTITAPSDITCQCLGGINPNPEYAVVQTSCTLEYFTEVSFVGVDGFMDCPGTTYTYEYKVTDECGRTATDLQVFTINNEGPVFDNCPENCLTLDCEDNYEVFIDGWLMSVTAHSSCGEPLEVTNDYDPDTQGFCFDDGFVLVTFTATDQCGRTSTCEGMILVLDTKAPKFGPIPMSSPIACNGTFEFDEIEATDNCSEVTLSYVDELVGNTCLGGNAIRTWTATDECGNSATTTQVVPVLPDMIPPHFTFIPGNYSIDCDGSIVFGEAVAVDDCNNVTLTFMDLTLNDTCLGGSAVRTWTATDDCGNSSNAVQTITILPDSEPPVFTSSPADTIISCDDPINFGVVTATDNCGNVNLDFEDVIVGDLCIGGTASRTWTATDGCGNTSQITQTIILLPDMDSPVLVGVPTDTTVQCSDVPIPPTVTATDNCDDNVDIEINEIISGQICEDAYTLERIWTATDDCGNSTTDSQVITVIDDIPPVLIGIPDDLTVECTDLPTPPMVTATDNCDPDVEITFMETITDTSCVSNLYQVVRTWTAVDNCGNESEKTQTIFLTDNSAPVFSNTPADATVECDSIPQIGDIIVEDECGNDVEVEFMETMIPGACANNFTLNRIWTATDSCGNVDTFTQVLTVEDNTPPTLNCPNDVTFNIQTSDTCSFFRVMTVTAFDNCDTILVPDFQIDFGTDLIIDSIGSLPGGASLSIDFPIGTNTVTFEVADDCGNVTSCSTVVQVNDLVPPAFFCNPQTINLQLPDSTTFILPEAFLSNPFNECCLDTLLIEDLNNPGNLTDTLFLDYADFELSVLIGGIPIEVFAIDCYGNQSSCNTKIFVLPPGVPPGFAYITGEVFTEENEYLETVEISLNGGMANSTLTTENGYYEFMDIPEGYDYHVEPFYNQDPANGITTWDFILLRKHILEIELLESPYKMIAADINRSGNISTIDQVELRKLILGIIPTFQSNTSWRFVDANFVFPNAADPFQSSFPEVCLINDLNAGLNNMDFVGVKIGDLNGSVETNFQGGSEPRNLNVFHFEAVEQLLQANEKITVPIRAKDFQEILGFQFSLQFDLGKLEFTGVEGKGLESFDLNSFGFAFQREGLITSSWSADEAVSIDPDQVLFELKFNTKAAGKLSDLLALNSAYTKAEIYDKNGEVADLELHFGSSTDASLAFELFQNRPNPFKEETIIGFSLEENTAAIFSVFNASGKLVWQSNETYPEGYHEIVLRKDQLDGGGVYFYQLRTGQRSAYRRMIILE